MAYVYGLCLLIWIVAASQGSGQDYWSQSLGPAVAVGGTLFLLLSITFGVVPLLETVIPTKGIAIYRVGHFGFFHGVGREFWDLPGAGLWRYFRYEVGFWVLGSLWLAWGGLTALFRLALRRSAGDQTTDDELVVTCAALHILFVTCFFGLRTSWTYYFTILILGLAVRAKGGSKYAAVIWCLAVMLLVNDRSKLMTTYHEWSTSAPSRETLGLWATPAEHAEWRKVLELTHDETPVLLAGVEGSVPLLPGFAPPIVAYLCPGLSLPVEIQRKTAQLATARRIVAIVGPEWVGFRFWPELVAALDDCTMVFEGRTFRVYERSRPPSLTNE
jgi:hypothetical protein